MEKDKTFLSGLDDLIKKHWKEHGKNTKRYEKIKDDLSFEGKQIYESYVNENNNVSFFWLIFPFKAAFYLAIFGLAMFYGFGLDILDNLKIIMHTLFQVYYFWIIVFLLEIIGFGLIQKRKKKEVLDYLRIL